MTTSRAGRVKVSDLLTMRREQLESVRGSANENYVIAAEITGNDAGAKPKTLEEVRPNQSKTDVIYVADIDILSDLFVQIRDYPIRQGIEYRYQDMSFVLNVIDALAGEETYLSLRNRKVKHVTLEVVERTYEKSMQEVYDQSQQFQIDFEVKRNQIINDISEKTRPLETAIKKELSKKDSGKSYDAVRLAAMQDLLNTERREQAEKFQTQVQELENERRDKKRRTDLDAELEIQEIQRKFKLAAVIIPPIPPLLVGLVVLTRRRLREREGISKARRLK